MGEFAIGAGFGAVAFVVLAFNRRRRWDWGLVWGAFGLLALFTVKGAWPRDVSALLHPVILPLALLIVAAVTVALGKGDSAEASPWHLVVSLLGVGIAVPDTEAIAVLLGLSVVVGSAWRPLNWSHPGWPGGFLVGCVVVAAIAFSARTRPTALAGALGAVSMVGLWSVPRSRSLGLLGFLAFSGVVVWWARVTSRASSPAGAVLFGLAVTLPMLALAWWIGSARRGSISSEPTAPP